MIYIFDGTYEGYLTCVFESFERREWDVYLSSERDFRETIFSTHRHITAEREKAVRVRNGLTERIGGEKAFDFLQSFLSEDPKAWQAGFRVIQQIFRTGPHVLGNYGDEHVLYLSQTLKKVSRERHRMKAFIRFSKTSDNLFFAVVEPDFNVLPLIAGFFKRRYADQHWLIYDEKRNYGLLYDMQAVSEVTLTPENAPDSNTALSLALDEREALFKKLWKRYYQSTNIEARRNMKLHLQKVPKRYWKHLVEKNT